jgi:hypothetical protein
MYNSNMEVVGSALGAMKWSDRRLKENIVFVGVDPKSGLNLYEFNYKSDPIRRYRGVMADEVDAAYPEAVIETNDGYFAVDYGAIGVDMVEV